MMINQYLVQMPYEMGKALYGAFGYLQYPAFIGILVLATVKYKAPVKDKLVLWLAFIVARFWGVSLCPILSRITNGTIPGVNMGVAFGFFVLILAAVVYFFKVPVLFSLDAAIPAFILGRGLAIIGCVFAGCCHGYPVSWGIYSCVTETLTFPTVLLDTAISCCITGYLLLLAQRQQYSGNGFVAAMGMLLFGVFRILIDVLRDNEKLFFAFTAEGFFGIVYVIAGALLLKSIYRKTKSDQGIAMPQNTPLPSTGEQNSHPR